MSLVKSKQRVADYGEVFTPAWMAEHTCQPIIFAEWGYFGKGKFQRRSLFASLGKHEIFTPARTYPPMAVSELATSTTTQDATL